MHPSDELAEVIKIAKGAAGIVLSYFNQSIEISVKDNKPYNFVTTADVASNDYINKALTVAFPGDQILLEESIEKPSNFSGRVWMADPLDGTKQFIYGGKLFSVIIGLCIDGMPQIGCVVDPIEDKVYWAEKGRGSYCTDNHGVTSQLHVSNCNKIEKSREILPKLHGEHRPSVDFLNSIPVKRRIPGGSHGLGAASIAKQEVEFFVNTNNQASKWDTCAAQVILEEAGGKITDIFGHPLNYMQTNPTWDKSFVASNGLLHQSVIDLLSGNDTLFVSKA